MFPTISNMSVSLSTYFNSFIQIHLGEWQMVLVAWQGYKCHVSKARMCEKVDILSPSLGQRKIKLQQIHITCSYEERNHCLCIDEHMAFLVSRKHHRYVDWYFSIQERKQISLYTTICLCGFKWPGHEKKLSFNYSHYMNQCAKSPASLSPVSIFPSPASVSLLYTDFSESQVRDVKHFWLYVSLSCTADPVHTVNDGNYSEGSRVLFISH